MADSIAKTNTRRKSSRAAPTDPDLVKIVKDDPVAALMALHMGMIDRMEHQPLGQILKIQVLQTEAQQPDKVVWLDFVHQQFHLGQMPDGMKDVLTPWPGLIPLIEPTDQLCPNCAVECDNCGAGFSVPLSMKNAVLIEVGELSQKPWIVGFPHSAKVPGLTDLVQNLDFLWDPFTPIAATVPCPTGWRPCSKQCGGLGVYRSRGKLCRHPNMDAAMGCPDCRGTNEIPVMSECPACKGVGIVKCLECQGTGKMSTGHVEKAGEPGGAKRVRLNTPKCPECEGRGKIVKRVPQEVQITDLGNDSYIGPIMSLMLKPPGRGKEPEIWTASADTAGQFMHLVSQHKFQAGTRCLILGGTLAKNL